MMVAVGKSRRWKNSDQECCFDWTFFLVVPDVTSIVDNVSRYRRGKKSFRI